MTAEVVRSLSAAELPDPMVMPSRRQCPLDPPHEYAALREERPWSRLRLPGGRVGWLVTRHEDARAVLTDPAFSPPLIQVTPNVDLPLPAEELQVPPGMFSAMDPPEQSRYRRLVSRHFTRKRSRELSPRIQQIVDEQLDGMAASGSPADLVRWFAQAIPTRVITEMLGIPEEDQEEYHRWVIAALTLATPEAELREAGAVIVGKLAALVAAKRANPQDDIISGLLLDDERPLTDEEVVSISVLLLIAGLETTANMLGLGAFALLEHPEQTAKLRADESLMDNAIEELLRYLTIVQFGLTRTAREETRIGDRVIPAGETIVVSLAAANRDPEVYPEAERLDLLRAETAHMAFGHGVHQCLGAQLARVEMKIAFTTLLRRFPDLRLAVPASEVPTGEDKVFYGVHELMVTWGA
ncbi:cytochrome P450 [Streptacidiphilus neutrinimicus]|uniref:cytochrome P450 n=1 Tax=Streptacidiphilus neutrinimicus TaxID=105420 RepID=UPI000B1D993D|nr:cytochrome P450 [Streptacidiphilus neutrinimicus]